MSVLATILLLALTRSEIIARLKAPVITQADGFIKVYAHCPEDMRREFQMPIASFAAETVKTLHRGLGRRQVKLPKAALQIYVGDVRTNLSRVVTSVVTNDGAAVTRLYVRSPGYADLYRLRLEVIKSFYRSVEERELTDADAVDAYRHADPSMRVVDERARLETWLETGTGLDDEEGLRLMRKIIEPGKASARDVLTFASRLFLYPPNNDGRFVGKFNCLSYREALKFARVDPSIRIVAARKADEMPVFGGGRGPDLAAAAELYRAYLLELAKMERSDSELKDLLDAADVKLNVAYEKAMKQ